MTVRCPSITDSLGKVRSRLRNAALESEPRTHLRNWLIAYRFGNALLDLRREARLVWKVTIGSRDGDLWPGMREPFNGQYVRLRTVRALISDFEPDAFIETGTFLGSTTRFFCGNGVPVYTIELKWSFWVLARLRLGWNAGVDVMRLDSITGLRQLALGSAFRRPLVYLDAHWWSDLPLAEELSAIFASWPEAIVVIDDFEVDGDNGYAFDRYGDVSLSLAHISLPRDVTPAFPAGNAHDETGARRGTLYLAKGAEASQTFGRLVQSHLLRSAHVDERLRN